MVQMLILAVIFARPTRALDRCPDALTLSVIASSYANAKPSSDRARNALVGAKVIKEAIDQCGPGEIEASYRKIYDRAPPPSFQIFSKEKFESLAKTLPDEVIGELGDVSSTPFGDTDGLLGDMVNRLGSTFPLTPLQKDRLDGVLRGIKARTKTAFKDFHDHCQTRELQSQLPASEDQGGSSLCYAFTLALEFGRQLLTADEQARDPISAAAIALVFQNAEHAKAVKEKQYDGFKDGPTTELGGTFEDAFRAVREFGACRESQVSSKIARSSGPIDSVAKYRQLFPALPTKQIQAAMRIGDPWTRTMGLLRQACPRPVSLATLDGHEIKRKNPEAGVDLLRDAQRRLLDHKVVPIGTGLLGHAMTLVGQQRDLTTGDCRFIIRNSYGPDCGAGRPDMPSYMTKTCDGKGNFTIAPSLLVEKLVTTYQIEPVGAGPSGGTGTVR